MKQTCVILFILCFLASCGQNNPAIRAGGTSGDKSMDSVISFSEDYFMDKLKDARVFIDDDGLITIINEMGGYKINQLKIVTGMIDEDNNEDAVVPFYSIMGQSVMDYYHMILLDSADTFKVVKIMNDVFNIHGIKEREIIAEVSTVSPDSPGFGCAECREVVKYRYINGDLVKAE
jgi:hypothetical protein